MAVVNLRDVAKHAGVSPGTVSNYLNHPHKVAEPTGRRIQAAISGLGYVTNPSARALRTGESRIIGHLTYEVGNPFFSNFSRGLQAAATAEGYEVVIGNSDGSAERETQLLRFFTAQRVAGLLLSPVVDRSREVNEIVRGGMPVVLLDKHKGAASCSVISVDDREGGRLAARHLLDIGCDRLHFVGGPLNIDAVQDRFNGAREVAEEADQPTLMVHSVPERTIRAGRAAAHQLAGRLREESYPGIFAANDLIAIGLLHGLLEEGLHIPQDLAIVGYDDIEFAQEAVVPLTSIRRPGAEFGEAALRQLTGEMQGNDPLSTTFAPTLIERASSRRP